MAAPCFQKLALSGIRLQSALRWTPVQRHESAGIFFCHNNCCCVATDSVLVPIAQVQIIVQDAHLPQVMSARVEIHCFCCEDAILADVEGHLQAKCLTQVDMYQSV